MTSNQIAYWKLQEEHRSNLVDEAERNRSNVAQENIKERDTQSQIRRREVQNLADTAKTTTEIARNIKHLFV